MPLPCGRCIGCRLERSRQWAIRLVHEASVHGPERSAFLTLTYDEEHLPVGGTLIKKHWQDFMKRLRKRFPGPIQYFHCGEYGERSRRPHYHACLFGIEFPDLRLYKENAAGRLYSSELLDGIWGHGECRVGAVTFESAAYVARYICKKVTGDMAERHYQSIDPDTGEIHELLPEYTTMSLKRPIGKEWWTRYSAEVTQSDSVVIRGREMKPPKYYDKLLERDFPEAYFFFKEERQAQARAAVSNATPERLAVRREVAEARLAQRKRTLE